MSSFGVAIVTYNGAARVEALLGSAIRDLACVDQLVIAEDPCPYPLVHDQLLTLAAMYNAELVVGDTWGCMQGNATRAMRAMRTDVVALLSDDIILSPHCLSNVMSFWERYKKFPIGAAQIPYWPNWTDAKRLGFITEQDQFFTTWRDWSWRIPSNPYWNGDGSPQLYINVHGSGFSLLREAWQAVGGFSPQTWSYDEDIAVRLWLGSQYVVTTIPGPPFMHYGGASQCGTEHPDTKFHTEEAWMDAWATSKDSLATAMRARMSQMDYLNAEMRQVNGVV